MSRRRRSATATASATGTAVATAPAPRRLPVDPPVDARDYAYDLTVELARSSFAAISNPRRRRLRKGDGGYHCDYRTVEELRNISRWLEYHSGSYGGALHNWSQYLVGSGPTYTPTTQDTDWNRKAAALLADDFKAKRHDIRGRFSWGKWIKLLATSIVRDGSMGVIHTALGPAQLIEAERVIAVHSDRTGRVTSYDVAEIKNGWLDYSTRETISPAMMDFCPVVTRVSQDLGIPLLFSTLDDHDGISDLWQAEIDSATESARPWMRIEHDSANPMPGGMTIPQALGAANESSPAQAPSARGDAPAGWVKTPNGNIMGIPKGLKSIVHQPERPNLDVPLFTKSVLRMACMMLLPYEFLFGDQADVSYSNGRSIRKLGNGLLNCFRSDYLDPTITRIAHALLRQHMVQGRLPMPKDSDGKLAWQKGKFEWDDIPEHDRIKERQADTIDLNNGTATLKDLVGEDWQQKMEQTAVETARRSILAAENLQKIQIKCNELNTQTPGLDIKWSHLVTIGGAASAPVAYLQAATGAVAVEKQDSEPTDENAKPNTDQKPAASPA